MILDYILGDPLSWPHPVIYIGKLIKKLENILIKKNNKKLMGFILVFIVLVVIYFSVHLVLYILSFNKILYYIFFLYALYSALAYRSLIKASRSVYNELNNNNIEEARVKLSYIVGRDTKELTRDQIIKATIETVAENTIDGVIAPLFYAFLGLLFNKPVHFIWVYKGINTMDSMVGYMNDKYMDFGYAAAKLDDIANYIPARIGSILMIIGGGILSLLLRKEKNLLSVRNSIKIYIRDKNNHKSPNSAHSESVVAGLLNIQLGGDNKYFGELVKKPTIGDNIREVNINDIRSTELILTVVYVMIFIGVIIYEI
jgi:adenosylcobinamide-phosphate synthase